MAEHLFVSPVLKHFIDTEALPGTGLQSDAFWAGFTALVAEFAPRNAALLAMRDTLQAQIDAWHREMKGKNFDATAYRNFLSYIGYLQPQPDAW